MALRSFTQVAMPLARHDVRKPALFSLLQFESTDPLKFSSNEVC